jgi:hypothetical protein
MSYACRVLGLVMRTPCDRVSALMTILFSQPLRSVLPLIALWLTACGGGGSSNPVTLTPTLASIALTPSSLTLDPNASVQLTVTGTYSDGSSHS